MKILHIGLLSHYTDGMLYQDNCLAEMNAKAGHDVIYITDTYKYKDGILVKTEEEDIVLNNGVRLIRLNYDKVVCDFITRKIQKVGKLYELIKTIQPDSILYHGVCGYELMNVARYKREHPEILFYVDSHEDFNNTARNIISKLAYKYIHGYFISKARNVVNKFLYISEESSAFLKVMYGLKDDELESFPLGGFIVDSSTQIKMRERLIDFLHLPKDAIICAHSGKLEAMKKTKELLEAFIEVKNNRLVMLIFGSIPEDQYNTLKTLIESDKRIHFLGWRNGDECIEILSGVDLYCQPGSQSATAQVAACCGCALMLYPHASYKCLYNDLPFYVKNKNTMVFTFNKLIQEEYIVLEAKNNMYFYAKRILSYQQLSQRYLH